MDFALNDEQRMLQEAARRFFTERHPLTRARRALPWTDADQPQLWREMAAMGWMSLLLPEAHGGLGLGLTEASLVAEEAGRQLLNLPWTSSAVILPLWLKADPHDLPATVQAAVHDAMAGDRALHCVDETSTSWDHVGQCTDIVVVRGWRDLQQPLQVSFQPVATQVGVPALDPTLLQAPALDSSSKWLTLNISPETRTHTRLAHRLMQAAELTGVAQAALDLSCAYAKDRVQFGKPIGSYQAIKHQLANVWMDVDNARLAVTYATAALDGALPDARFSCAAAEFAAINGALRASRMALQVHGGIGFTWEHDAHLYLKRALHLTARLGGASHALSEVEGLSIPSISSAGDKTLYFGQQ